MGKRMKDGNVYAVGPQRYTGSIVANATEMTPDGVVKGVLNGAAVSLETVARTLTPTPTPTLTLTLTLTLTRTRTRTRTRTLTLTLTLPSSTTTSLESQSPSSAACSTATSSTSRLSLSPPLPPPPPLTRPQPLTRYASQHSREDCIDCSCPGVVAQALDPTKYATEEEVGLTVTK